MRLRLGTGVFTEDPQRFEGFKMGFRVWGSGFGVWGLGFRVWGLAGCTERCSN